MPGDPHRSLADAVDVIDVLSDLFILRGVPGYIRSDNGLEFVAKAVQEWIAAVGARESMGAQQGTSEDKQPASALLTGWRIVRPFPF